jgi:[acyl-carrier-protein] S-malonyltransferase
VNVAVVFPGQGSQFPEMVEPWMDHPVSAAAVHEASEALGIDVAAAVRQPGALDRTDVTQLALLTCEVAAWRVLEHEGLRPVAAAGHSLGEFAALVATGAASFAAALDAVKARAEAMQRACEERPGAMLAVMGLPRDEIAAVCAEAAQGDDLVVANENHPLQTVISGEVAAVERAAELAKARNGHPVRLPVAGAFHSPLMAAGLGQVAAAVTRMGLVDPQFAVVENVSAEPTTDAAALEDLLCRHLVSPVRWVASVQAMADMGVELFVEAGPGDVLTRAIRRCLPTVEAVAVGTPEEAAEVARRVPVTEKEKD